MPPATSFDGIETALIVLAIAQGIQTLLFLAILVGGWVAYSRLQAAARDEIQALRLLVERAVDTVHETAQIVSRAATTVNDTVADGRDAVHAVTSWASPIATAVGNPKAAAATAVWRGIRWWRHRRDAARHRRALLGAE